MQAIQEILKEFEKDLKKAGIGNFRQESRWILSYVLGVSAAEIGITTKIFLNKTDLKRARRLVSSRCHGAPLSRLIGVQEFWGMELALNEATLDPRQDTETLIEYFMKASPQDEEGIILDFGTGSGCIALAILKERPYMKAIGVDVSLQALKQARINAKTHKLCDRFWPLCASWGGPLSGMYKYIVSNPPYIKSSDIANLDGQVTNFDPILALDGGNDGLNSIHQIIFFAKSHLCKNGKAFIEIGYDQEEHVARLIENAGFKAYDVHPDIAGIPRVVEISNGDK